jgi:hypothetical protein
MRVFAAAKPSGDEYGGQLKHGPDQGKQPSDGMPSLDKAVVMRDSQAATDGSPFLTPPWLSLAVVFQWPGKH